MRIFPILLASFIIVPIAEVALFITVGQRIGVLNTVAVIFVTAFVGAALVARQGRQTFSRFQREAAMGRVPGAEIADGSMILFAGALLLTPGFLTDAIGFSLLVPRVRAVIRRFLARRFQGRIVIR